MKTMIRTGVVHRIGVSDVQVKLTDLGNATKQVDPLKILKYPRNGKELSGFLGKKMKFKVRLEGNSEYILSYEKV